jgi:[CysO sulfur-carrier protein]-S-L-cysteine hydrolase
VAQATIRALTSGSLGAVASAVMQLTQELYDEMVAHARAEEPNESCGMLAAANGRLTAFFPAENEFASPMRFRIAAQDQIRIYNEIDERGEEVAIFHSHPNTEAAPSQTDINLAVDWPGAVWVICSLADDEPVVRAFRIDGPTVEELDLVVG